MVKVPKERGRGSRCLGLTRAGRKAKGGGDPGPLSNPENPAFELQGLSSAFPSEILS
jgi:hypothetical protein